MFFLFRVVIVLGLLCYASCAFALPKDGFCLKFLQSEIPVGDFQQPLVMPETPLRITQKYNNTKAEGYCMVNSLQPDANSPLCVGKQIYFGHDGLDMHPQGAAEGEVDVLSVQSGLVVASHPKGPFGGWGESIIIATRANLYSEEILTFHYHHLFFNKSTKVTTRLFGACDQVTASSVIAKEGGTPNWPSHLHFGIKHWANLRELQDKIKNSPGNFYGSGYTYGDNSKLANFLNPQGFLLDTFFEFSEKQSDYSTWQWSQDYARQMRYRGWHFGNFDGSFGVDREVTRREAARWIKQAMRLSSATPAQPHFADLPLKDNDSPYVEALLSQPLSIRVISPDHSCTQSGTNFCPDQSLTRAEALKMIITGFYQDEFLDLYTNWVWLAAAPLANNLLSHFVDVSAYSWYAPYVYFALQQGLTAGGSVFNPGLPIHRAELAKWLVIGAEHHFGPSNNLCQGLPCPAGKYCDQNKHSCQQVPICLPQEGSDCPLGGGYQNLGNVGAGEQVPDAAAPSPGATCNPGQEQLEICPDGKIGTYRVCYPDSQWSEWNPPCFSSGAGGDAQTTTSSQTWGAGGNAQTTTTSQTWGAGGKAQTTSSSTTSSSSSSTSTTSTTTSSSTTSSSTSSTTSSTSQPPPPCTVAYHLSPAGASCYSNPSASGTPTLCLETTAPNGPTSSWRLCKQSGSFQNAFTYEPLDQNHLNHFLGAITAGAAGTSCTPWQQANFSYINQNGPVNGAGLIIEVHSPSGCSSPACTYYTGITTLYRTCQ